MEVRPSTEAWNNFVLRSKPSAYEVGSSKRSAAIANLFMGLANNGGINSFLTSSYKQDASEVLDSLLSIGALMAAKQLGNVLRELGSSLPPSSQEARWSVLDHCWSESLDEYDTLSEEADHELMRVLECHVYDNEEFYLALE